MKISLSKMYVDDEIRQSVIDVLDSGQYVKGQNLKFLEKDFANFCTTRNAIGLSSGTAAILLALIAIGIERGDEVIVPSHTFIASASPVVFLGGKTVFADIDPSTYTVDPTYIEKKVTSKTKAIMSVHLYGHPCDMDPILDIAKKHNLFVIEDACQAHGASYKGHKVGSIGDIGCFSFFPSKNLTVLGDGGMITTNNEQLARKVAMLRDHGRSQKYVHEILGLNFRMSEIHAVIGRQQLKHISEWNEKRRAIAMQYNTLLKDIGVVTPVEKPWARHVYHLYVIKTKKRDEMANYLMEQGIGTGIHYPIPVHKQPCLDSNAYLPITENCATEVLSLPMHPQLKPSEIVYVCNKIIEFVGDV